MPSVTNTIHRPGGGAVGDGTATVTVELVGSGGTRAVGYVSASDLVIEGVVRPAVSASGVWSATLTANSLIVPVGSKYKIVERVDDVSTVHYVDVPNGAGPYVLEDILSDGAPGALTSVPLQAHLDDTVDAHDATAISAADAGGYYTGTELEAVTQEIGASLALKAPLASPTFTGVPAAPTAAQGTNTTQVATTAMVQSEVALLAPKASPTFTGTVTAAGLTVTGALAHQGSTAGFFNATPAAQIAGATDVLAGLVTLGLRAASSNPPMNLGAGLLTAGSARVGVGKIEDNSGLTVFRHSSNNISTGYALQQDSFANTYLNAITTLLLRVGNNDVVTVNATTITMLQSILMADAEDIALGTSTGTKIGTATTQKLGFYNATPVVQPAGTTDVLASLVTLGLRAASSNPPLNLGTGAVTAGLSQFGNMTIGDVGEGATFPGLRYAGLGDDSYALLQDSVGGTYINAASTKKVSIRINNSEVANFDSAEFALAKVMATAASSTTSAGLRLPHGSAPTTPVDGDMWTTTAGLFVRINGTTVGPLS